MDILIASLTAGLLASGFWQISAAILYHNRYTAGRKSIQQIGRWYKQDQDIWSTPWMKRLVNLLYHFVYLDSTSKEALSHQLQRAGLNLTPEQFTARKYIVFLFAGFGILACVLLEFWYGVIVFSLGGVYLIMRQREGLTARIAVRDEAIASEMPRFVRTLCRTLHNDRDIYSALASYRKVAGPVLAEELDILLSHMRTGGTGVALQQFQKRIGTDSAFRLCSTLQEIDRGIDQSATLTYLADDMAQQSKLNIQKKLSTRPGKMRLTYLPAVAVCVAMILYVLVIFVMNQLNNLY